MTISTLRPNGTTSNTGTLTGGATAHAVLSDDSDSSYVDYASAGQASVLALGDLTLPAGAVVKSLKIRLRVQLATPTASELTAKIVAGAKTSTATLTVSNYRSPPFSVTWLTLASAGISDANVDGATLTISKVAAGAHVQVYEAYVDATYVVKPVVAVDAPSGTVTDTNRPTVSWTNTFDADGGEQTILALKVFTAAQYGAGGFNPETSTPFENRGGFFAGSSLQVNSILADGTYRAYVKTGQTVNGVFHWSDWAFTEFTVSVALPATPTLTATADNANARIALAVADAAGVASTDAFELERSLDAGTTWEAVRQLDEDPVLNAPVIVATGAFSDAADATTHAAVLPAPSGGILADDLLIAVAGMDGNPSFTWPSDWTEIKDVAGNGSAVRAGVAWKRAIGGETGTITVTTSASEGGAVRILCVRGAHTTTAPEVSTGVGAATANADPDSLNPSGWDTEHTLWIAAMVNDGNVAVTAGPSGYFDFGNTRWANASGAGVATAFKHSSAASEDPGAFTQTAEDTHAFTVGVRPASPSLIVYDYEAPNGTTMSYRVRALHNYSGLYAASAWVQDTEAWSSDSWWLKQPNLPELNMAVRIRSFQTVARAGRQGVFQALGASFPVVVSDVRESSRGTVVLRLDSTGEQDALDDLLDTAGTLLLQSPPDQGGPDYIRVVNHQRDRVVDWADAFPSFDALEFVVVGVATGTIALFPSDSLFPE